MNEQTKIMPSGGIQISKLSEKFQETVLQEVKCYSVGLALETHTSKEPGGPKVEDCKLVGSGTLVKWLSIKTRAPKYGIMTAEHVPSFPKNSDLRLDTHSGSEQRLRVLFLDRVNTFGFEARALAVHSLLHLV